MNPYLIYAKLGAVGMLLMIAFAGGWYFGGMRSKTAAEALHATQLQAVVNQMDENARQAKADHAHLQGVIDAYHALPIDPIVPGLAHRVYVYAASTCSGGVSPPGTVAPRSQTPAALPGSAGRVEQSLAAYIDACAADSAQLNAVIQLAP